MVPKIAAIAAALALTSCAHATVDASDPTIVSKSGSLILNAPDGDVNFDTTGNKRTSLRALDQAVFNLDHLVLGRDSRSTGEIEAGNATAGGLGLAIDNLINVTSDKFDALLSVTSTKLGQLIANRQTGFLTSVTTDCGSDGCPSGENVAVTAFGRFLTPGAPYVCTITHSRNESDPYDAGVVLSAPATVVVAGAGVVVTCTIPGGAARNVKHAEFDAVFTLVEGGELDIPKVTGSAIIFHFVNEGPVIGIADRTVVTSSPALPASRQQTIPVSIEDINTPDIEVLTINVSATGNTSAFALDGLEFRLSDQLVPYIFANLSAGAIDLVNAGTDVVITFEIVVADRFDHVSRASASLVLAYDPCPAGAQVKVSPTSCSSTKTDPWWNRHGSNCNSLSDGVISWGTPQAVHWNSANEHTTLYFAGGAWISEVNIYQLGGGYSYGRMTLSYESADDGEWKVFKTYPVRNEVEWVTGNRNSGHTRAATLGEVGDGEVVKATAVRIQRGSGPTRRVLEVEMFGCAA